MTKPFFLTDLSSCNDNFDWEAVEFHKSLHPDTRRIEIPSERFNRFSPLSLVNAANLSLMDPNIEQLQEFNTVPDFSIPMGVTDAFSAQHFNGGVRERLNVIESMCELARSADILPTVYLHGAFCCPFEGPTAPQTVAGLAAKLLRAGCAHFCLTDNCGSATPEETLGLINVVSSQIPKSRLGFLFSQGNPKLNEIVASARNSGIHRFCYAQLPQTPVPLTEKRQFVPPPEVFNSDKADVQEI